MNNFNKTIYKLLAGLAVAAIVIAIILPASKKSPELGADIREGGSIENLSEVRENELDQEVFKAKAVSEIKATRSLTSEQKEKQYKIVHGVVTIPESKEDLVLVKERYEDKEFTIENRLEYLQRVMSDALANVEVQQNYYDNAKSEYEELLTIYNQ